MGSSGYKAGFDKFTDKLIKALEMPERTERKNTRSMGKQRSRKQELAVWVLPPLLTQANKQFPLGANKNNGITRLVKEKDADFHEEKNRQA